MKIPAHINIRLSNDAEIQEMNKNHFGRDYPTDVLSFSMDEAIEMEWSDGEDSVEYILGDIIVNVDQAKRQAQEYGNDLEHEIAELVEHGVLHLLGVHHDDDDEKSVHGVSKNGELTNIDSKAS